MVSGLCQYSSQVIIYYFVALNYFDVRSCGKMGLSMCVLMDENFFNTLYLEVDVLLGPYDLAGVT